MKSFRPLLLAACFALLLNHGVAQQNDPMLSPEVKAIIAAGSEGNQVQEHLDYLTNRIGPRLTSSEGLQEGCEWAREKFEKMGLENCRLEKWGEFPVGFERGVSKGRMIEPKGMNLVFGTNSWTAGTKGKAVGNAIIAPTNMEELEQMRDEIKGNFVLVKREARFGGRRGGRRRPGGGGAGGAGAGGADTDAAKKAAEEKAAAEKAAAEKAAAEKADEEAGKPKPLTPEQQAELRDAILACEPAGLVYNTSDERILTGGRYQIDWDNLPTIPVINLLKEQWDEISELAAGGEEVKLAFDIRNHFRKGPIPLYNVIAEIPGTEIPDEFVVVGGHIDSWDGATGATDNGAGCATTIEAARILMAAKVKPKRTIRFMLWSGEEQGLLGSRAYVEQNKDEVQKISAVFVHDGGTNYVSGIRCTKAMEEDFQKVFAAALNLDERAPFEISITESMRPRGGSDHVPFIRAGVPGFFWNQRGRAVYRTTHHTQYDTYDTVVPEYQKHSSIVIALGAFGTANLDHLLPREGIQTQ